MKALNDKQIKAIKEHFNFFDRDNNGAIDVEEFAELLTVLSPESTQEQAQKGFSLIDTDGSGYIEFDEFLEWWKTCWWEYQDALFSLAMALIQSHLQTHFALKHNKSSNTVITSPNLLGLFGPTTPPYHYGLISMQKFDFNNIY